MTVVLEFDIFTVPEADNCVTLVVEHEDTFEEVGVIQKEKWPQ